jgi:hypothetical protein
VTWHKHQGETFFESATRISIKHKMPTRAIRSLVHDLTTQMQIMLSHIEDLPSGTTKAQQTHVKAIKIAMKDATRIIGKIQNLATIELDDHSK